MRLKPALVITCAACSVLSASAQTHWIATWAASASRQPATAADRSQAHFDLNNQTTREVVHVSLGGDRLRVRLSNEFGSETVQIGAAHVASCDENANIRPGTDHALTFSDRSNFAIPPNAPYISDPVNMTLAPDSNLCISLFIPKQTAAAGIHYDALQKNYLAPGDVTGSPNLPPSTISINSWLFLAGVDVVEPEAAATIVAFGDSITDGARSTLNANHRWPNILAGRLIAAHRDLAVVDSGIGGNRILHDASDNIAFGVNGLSRFERDALGEPGAKYVIVLEGINDLGHPGGSAPLSQSVTADDLIAGLKQMIARAHEHQIKIFGATLTPFEGTPFPGYYTPEKEKERERLNDWIRTSGAFDGVIDFDKAVQDPANPIRMQEQFNSGDHLHPNDAGYKAMGEAINLSLFK